jgi:hypothetical protein
VGDLSDFARGRIIGVPLTEASVTQADMLLGVFRVTASKVMSANINHGKTTAAARNSDRKRRIFERSKNYCNT